jgi:DNA-directed RNA polymerase specialized sigma subunit
MRAFEPVVMGAANKYIRNPKFPLHPAVIKAQFQIQLKNAFETFNPRRGVQLNTHVFNTMKKATRYLIRHQTLGVIPESRALRAREFIEGRARLAEILGREASSMELAEHLKWSQPEVTRMESELRQTSPTSQFEDEPVGVTPSRENEVIHMLQYELDGESKLVYEYLFGQGGKPKLTPGQIATKLGWTPSKVTRVKNKIIEKVKGYL